MIFYRLLFFLILWLSIYSAQCQSASPVFKIIPLGVKGGSDEGNLSSYMLAVNSTEDYICLDAGTLYDGIQKAIDSGILTGPVNRILKQQIKGYLISHPHLDHVAGLIINSPGDSSKNIYAPGFCLDVLRDSYFTWKSWANFGDKGDTPVLKKYHYTTLTPGTETAIEQTSMSVIPFLLSHAKPHLSTAFLVRYGNSYLLYLGDTGADTIEGSDNLDKLWHTIAPLVIARQLKAILIETSFPDEKPRSQLFGHLTPGLLMQEMRALNKITGGIGMKDLPVVITHIKPDGNNEELIKKELLESNSLQLKIIFPQQANLLNF